MDESRRDRHQRILGECLSKIQHDFSDQKQQLHRHLIDGLQWQLAQLQNGSHPEFLYLAGLPAATPATTTPATTTPATTTTINRRKQPVITTSQSGLLKSLMTNSKLERERAEVVWRAEYWRDYMLSLTDALHRQEIATIDAEYRSEKNGLKGKMLSEIADRKRRLQEDRDLLSIDTVLTAEDATDVSNVRSGNVVGGRKLRKRATDYPLVGGAASNNNTNGGGGGGTVGRGAQRNKLNQMATLGFALTEHEIEDDLEFLARLRGSLSNGGGGGGSSSGGGRKATGKRLRYR